MRINKVKFFFKVLPFSHTNQQLRKKYLEKGHNHDDTNKSLELQCLQVWTSFIC